MIYREILDHGLDLGSEESGDDYEDMLKFTVNMVYREILEETQADTETREFTLTTIANVSQYGCPLYVRRILNINDPTDNNKLDHISASQYDRSFPDATSTGAPLSYYDLAIKGVQRHPIVNSTLKVVSSSTNDDGASYKLYARGFVNDVLTREEITMDGTTIVTSSTTFDAGAMERITLKTLSNKTFLGTVTVKDATITDAVSTASVTPTTTTWAGSSSLSSTDDIYNGKTLTFTSGANNGTSTVITDYDGSDRKVTVETAVTAPSNADTFTIDGWNIAEIPPYYGSSPSYQWIEFNPIPSDKRDLTVRCEMAKAPLVNDDDWPDIPEEYHDLLVWGPAAALMPAVGKTAMGDRYQNRFNRRLKRYMTGQQKRRGMIRTFENVTNVFVNSGPNGARFPRNTATSVDLL